MSRRQEVSGRRGLSTATPAPVAPRRWAPSTEALFIGALVLWGWRLGAQPIGDNSMFVHLRTGIDMVAGLGIPRTDPYSWTAAGHDWTVQSWLASWTYGWLHRIGGFELVVIEQAVLMAALAGAMAWLARAGTPLRTGLAGVLAVGVGSPLWVPRPLLFGLLGLAVTVLVVERRLPGWALLPVVWLWVNTHGSFPLGLAWLLLRVAGEWLDDRRTRPPTSRYAGWFAAGLALAAVNPLGARLLVFPFTVLEKREAFQTIVEWRPPDLGRTDALVSVLFLVAAAGALVWGWRRSAGGRLTVPWCDALPVLAFVAASSTAMRNLPMAAIVLAPALGRALRLRRGEGPTTAPPTRPSPPAVNRAFAVVLVFATVLFGLSALTGPGIEADPEREPVAAAAWLDERGWLEPGVRLAHDEVAGGWLLLRYGRQAPVFMDDRFDMYPLDLSRDLDALLAGGDEALAVLHDRDVELVLWRRGRALSATLEEAGWRVAYDDEHFKVFTRPDR